MRDHSSKLSLFLLTSQTQFYFIFPYFLFLLTCFYYFTFSFLFLTLFWLFPLVPSLSRSISVLSLFLSLYFSYLSFSLFLPSYSFNPFFISLTRILSLFLSPAIPAFPHIFFIPTCFIKILLSLSLYFSYFSFSLFLPPYSFNSFFYFSHSHSFTFSLSCHRSLSTNCFLSLHAL